MKFSFILLFVCVQMSLIIHVKGSSIPSTTFDQLNPSVDQQLLKISPKDRSKRPLKVWLFLPDTTDGQKSGTRIKGELLSIQDSTILVKTKDKSTSVEQQIPFSQVQKMYVRKTGIQERGFGIGLLGGSLIGVVLGIVEGEDIFFSLFEVILILATFFGLIGAVLGLIATSFRFEIDLNDPADLAKLEKLMGR